MTTIPQFDLQGAFGFEPKESTHHFLVNLARSRTAEITISEHYSWDAEHGSSKVTYGVQADGQVRVVLPRLKWDAIADEVRAHFNLRLRRMAPPRKPGVWRVGPNLMRRELGKELVLLAWAIEDADPALIPTALANWLGLQPEERWWLYTQTAAASGHGVTGRSVGWRKAVRYALTENPAQANRSPNPLPEWFPDLVTGANEAQGKEELTV
ncbi:MAG: DUF3780 domain-containing protein [Chloroflexi bacterium]|nr:MAG: DUF3780 domain-containing protein [Chloroflexota bacterium]